MQELRIVLIIVGIIAITGLLAHGFWTSRRNRPEKLVTKTKRRKKDLLSEQTNSDVSSDDSEFDDLGVSEVRVVGESNDVSDRLEPELNFDETSDEDIDEVVLADDVAKPQKDEVSAQLKPDESEQSVSDAKDDKPIEPNDVYALNVVASDGQSFSGEMLFPCLENLGLQFGQMDIYHRYLHADGQGPILFSVANMVKPGTFDPQQMEQFSTQGVSLFMTVPCESEPSRNFNVMYNAAQRIVSDLNGVLLDGHRNPFTAQTLQHYQQRIREYERQQLLQKS
ncbi:MAG: Cell division protein ZipA [Candidatus Celerinatantimonas neptuna]|nr:MAG: Cell division protein ZipA [Candidatus Celerinatantimonas neptuna]